MKKIFVQLWLGEKERKALEKQTDQHHLIFRQDNQEKDLKASFETADYAFGNVPKGWLSGNKQLKWLQLESVGFGEYQDAEKSDTLQITNLKGMFGVPVAETAIAGILSLFRGLEKLSKYKTNHHWEGANLRDQLRTIAGSRVIILGNGDIGQQLSKRLIAFGAEIKIMGKEGSDTELNSLKKLDEAIPHADIIINCLPSTTETKNIINTDRISLMDKNAIFVNLGRGDTVDEQALVKALQGGEIGGCVLDVTQEEPLPKNHPLWDYKNAIITQHTGGGSEKELLNKVKIFTDNLERLNQGKTLNNIINLAKGY